MEIKTIYLELLNKYIYIPIAALVDDDIIPISQLFNNSDDNQIKPELVSCKAESGEVKYFLFPKYVDDNGDIKYLIEMPDVDFVINTDGSYDFYLEELEKTTTYYIENYIDASTEAIPYDQIGQTFINIINPQPQPLLQSEPQPEPQPEPLKPQPEPQPQLQPTPIIEPQPQPEPEPEANLIDNIEVDIVQSDMSDFINDILDIDNTDEITYSEIEEADSQYRESVLQGTTVQKDIVKQKSRLEEYANSIRDIVMQSKQTDTIIKRNQALEESLSQASNTDNLIEAFTNKTKNYAQLVDSIPETGVNPDLKIGKANSVNMLGKVLIQSTTNPQYNLTEKAPERKSTTEDLENVLKDAEKDVDNATKAVKQADEIVEEIKAIKTVDYLNNKEKTVYTMSELLDKLYSIKQSLSTKKPDISNTNIKPTDGPSNKSMDEADTLDDPFSILNNTVNEASKLTFDIEPEPQPESSQSITESIPQPTQPIPELTPGLMQQPLQPAPEPQPIFEQSSQPIFEPTPEPVQSSQPIFESLQPAPEPEPVFEPIQPEPQPVFESIQPTPDSEPVFESIQQPEPIQPSEPESLFTPKVELGDSSMTGSLMGQNEENVLDLDIMGMLSDSMDDEFNPYGKEETEITMPSPTIGLGGMMNNNESRNTVTISSQFIQGAVSNMMHSSQSVSNTDFEDFEDEE